MNHRRIIIGDVHGHYQSLILLLEAIAPGKDDQVYFLGDLIDRGSQSAKVVQFVMDNQYPCIRGNHEEMLLAAIGEDTLRIETLQAWVFNGGHATISSYDNKIPQDHIDWMKNLPLYLDLDDIWLVHAGVHPYLAIDQQDSDHFCWIRDEFHSISKPYFPDKLIITGHTITFTLPGVKPGQIAAGNGWLDIDTGAYHQNSGWLTGLDVTEGKVYQIHTPTKKVRTVSLEEAITYVDIAQVGTKRIRKLAV